MIKTYKVHIRYPHLSISAITSHLHNPINSQITHIQITSKSLLDSIN